MLSRIQHINPNNIYFQSKSNIVKQEKNIENKLNFTQENNKQNKNPFKIIAGLFLAEKGVTSGIRRILGIRIENHTTSKENAKNIIKNGCVLDPVFGGKGASQIIGSFEENSSNFVHITGFHKDFKKSLQKPDMDLLKEIIKEKMGDKNYSTAKKIYHTISDTPLLNFVRAGYRKIQKMMYTATSTIKINKSQNDNLETFSNIVKDNFSSKKQTLGTIFNIITGRKVKTFYIGGTDDFFNKNFVPDIDDFALKTTKKLKVSRTKITATLEALKKEGLSGIKQNPTRVIAGLVIAISCLTLAYKFLKEGICGKENKKDNKTY